MRVGAAFVVFMTLALASCSSQGAARSVAHFCSTYDSEKAKFTKQYSSADGVSPANSAAKALTGLLMGVQSIGDVTVILTKLDASAPTDIEPDVAAVLQSWKGMQGTMGDEAQNAFNPSGLVGAMMRGLLLTVESNGSWVRVGNYVQTHCSQPR